MDYKPVLYIGILAACVMFAIMREKKSSQKRRGRLPNRAQDELEQLERPLGDYVMRTTCAGEPFSCSGYSGSTVRLQWVSRETASDGNPRRMRIPKSSSRKYRRGLPFTAAGKRYISTDQLTVEKSADGTFRDSNGRVVLCVAERFPCFDSSDMLNEDRYYRWWLIVEDGMLTRVFSADESKEIHVTEDVLDLEERCTTALNKYDYLIIQH